MIRAVLSVIAVLMVCSHASAQGADPRALVMEGNRSYQDDAFADALERYDAALEAERDDLVAEFNRGCALYELGKLDEAAEAFRKVYARTKDERLAAQASYNLGRTELDAAQRMLEERLGSGVPELDEDGLPVDPVEIIDDVDRVYDSAARQFRQALRHDASDAEAGRNLEITRRRQAMLRDLRQQIEQMQQAMQELAEQAEQVANEQEGAADESRQQMESGDSPANAGEQQGEVSGMTDGLRERMEQLQQQGVQSPNLEQAKDAVERAQDQQRAAEDAIDRNETEQAEQLQRDASESLREAAQQLRGEPQQQQQSEGEQQEQESSGEGPEEPQQGSGEQQQAGGQQDQDQQGDGAPDEPTEQDTGGEPDSVADMLIDRSEEQAEQLDRTRRRMTSPAAGGRDW